jgi:hypothetical protein
MFTLKTQAFACVFIFHIVHKYGGCVGNGMFTEFFIAFLYKKILKV